MKLTHAVIVLASVIVAFICVDFPEWVDESIDIEVIWGGASSLIPCMSKLELEESITVVKVSFRIIVRNAVV